MEDKHIEWHHGSVGISCSSDGPTPVSKLGKKRTRYEITRGKHAGKNGILADCPKCGRWIQIGIE